METEDGKIEYLLNFDSGDFAKEVSKVFTDDPYNLEKKSEHVGVLLRMCEFSQTGLEKAITIMEQIKEASKEKYRFEWLMKELLSDRMTSSDYKTDVISGKVTSSEYKNDVMRLINAIVGCNQLPIDKKLIQYEFIGLRIGEVFKQLRSNRSSITASLINEILKFEENLKSDDGSANVHIDVDQHSNIFYAIMQKVKGTPTEGKFLFCLQSLLQIDASQKWDCIARFLDKVSTVEANKLENLLKNEVKIVENGNKPGIEHGVCKLVGCACSCHVVHVGDSPLSFKMKVKQKEIEEATITTPLTQPPPPPPPPPPPSLAFPPPPPLPPIFSSSDPKSQGGGRKLPQIPQSCPPIPPSSIPPPFGLIPPPPLATQGQPKMGSILPTPKKKMRRLQWNKIPAGVVLGKKNIWTAGCSDVLRNFNPGPSTQQPSTNEPSNLTKAINFEAIENMFALRESPVTVPGGNTDEKDGKPELKKRKLEEVSLLDSKRSLNINIFLHQIRFLHKDLICKITSGDSTCLSIEKLKGLLRILPEPEEIEVIRSYKGDPTKLGNAEKFYLELSHFPNFSSCVEVLLTKEEFSQITDIVRPALDSYILTAQDIKDSKLLQEIFQIVLITGNFLNSGGFSGDAVAFKLSSLLNLTELKSNEPGLTLMHFIAQTASEKNPKLLSLPEQLKWLKETSQYSYDSIIADVSSLRKRVETVRKHSHHVGPEMGRKLETFLEVAVKELEEIEERESELETLRLQLAEYFCEDEKSFNIDDAVKVINSFVDRFEKAVAENSKRVQRIKSREPHVQFRRQSSLPREPDKSGRFQKCMSENLQEKLTRVETVPNFHHQRSTDGMVEPQDTNLITPPVREAEKKIRQLRDTTGDEELMEMLNFGSTNSVDMASRSRRKPKTPVFSTFVDEDRERTTPDFDLKSPFVRNKASRRTMIDFRTGDRERISQIFDNLPDLKRLDASQTKPTTKYFESRSIENNLNENKEVTMQTQTKLNSFQRCDQASTLTEQALLKHIQSKGKTVEDEEGSRFESTRQKIAEYRQKEAAESRQLQSSRTLEISKENFAPIEKKVQSPIESSDSIESSPSSTKTTEMEIKYRKTSSTDNLPGDAANCRSSEIESISSGTDEGFESMRNSVHDESSNRVSPLTQQPQLSEDSNIVRKVDLGGGETKVCDDDKSRTLTRSCGSLSANVPLTLPKTDQDLQGSPLQGAKSMVMIHRDTPSSPNDIARMTARLPNRMGSRDMSAPQVSSTSTLKSSSSGLHVSNDQPENDYDGHLQVPQTLQRTSSLSDNSTTSDNSKKNHKTKDDIDKVTARLSQPKRFSINSSHSASQQSLKKPVAPAGQPPSRQSSFEKFIRGSTVRTTLPANVLNYNKKKASGQHHPQKELNSIAIPEGSNLEDTPPKPPVRTTSISNSGHYNSSRRLTMDCRPPSKTRSNNNPLNTTITCNNPTVNPTVKSEVKPKNADKSVLGTSPEKPNFIQKLFNGTKNQSPKTSRTKSQSSKSAPTTTTEEPTIIKRPVKPGIMTLYKK